MFGRATITLGIGPNSSSPLTAILWLNRSGACSAATDNAHDQTTGQYIVADVPGEQWTGAGRLQLTVDCIDW